jgi:hypothetical protein
MFVTFLRNSTSTTSQSRAKQSPLTDRRIRDIPRRFPRPAVHPEVRIVIQQAGALDAWGSNVLGGIVAGLLGAVFVVIGVWYAQLTSAKLRRIDVLQETA